GRKSETIPEDKKYFWGYERLDGRAGVRNELWVVPTTGCVNAVAKAIAEGCLGLVGGSIEAVTAFAHPYGCSQMGEDQEHTRTILADLVHHPNAGGVLIVGLGCENSGIGVLKEYIGKYDDTRVRFLQCQDCGDEVEEGICLLQELACAAGRLQRTKIRVEKLVVGLKCGGSDGLSGITANPAVGQFSDILTELGGSTILTEVPEMFGAETILMDRADDREVFEKTVRLINGFKEYFSSCHQPIYENPSPGNKEGGLSTLEDKAWGCTQKSGSSNVKDVLAYGQLIEKAGLNLLSAPGNDLVASTALAASGAQIILFTTGRGTPFASIVPTIKLSTNTELAVKKAHWIDFDCGRLLHTDITTEMLGRELYEYVLTVAGGMTVKSERAGYRDLALFKQGVTL
ncbi:MAG TPA: UxaA family hydrolase, partial [Lachnospiraceae bacterium]|nr:UxaA family hydrolase [Lachnospiraceae bacterium]